MIDFIQDFLPGGEMIELQLVNFTQVHLVPFPFISPHFT